ncbi:MAG TPA: hypothetical protein VGL39_26925, partial [Jatrophihabitantaceae bacterium]
MSDLLALPPDDEEEDGSRGRAVWGLVALAIIAALIVVILLCGPETFRTERSGDMPDTVLVFGSASARGGFAQGADAEGIDEGRAVV